MSEHKLTPLQIQAFARHLLLEEKSAAPWKSIFGYPGIRLLAG